MKAFRDFMRFYIVPIVLLAGVLLTAGFTGFYTVTARTGEGRIVSSNWPRTFTLDFARHIVRADGTVALTDAGRALLDANGLWVQVLDASGAEALSYRKPTDTPDAYRPYELLRLYQNGDGAYSVFLSDVECGDASYTYLIGFPLSISKVVLYVDADRYDSGRVLVLAVVALTAVLVVTLSVYSYRTFRSAQSARERDERAQEEWLANITHDL